MKHVPSLRGMPQAQLNATYIGHAFLELTNLERITNMEKGGADEHHGIRLTPDGHDARGSAERCHPG